MSKTLARLLIGLVEAATRLRPGWRCPHTRLLVSEGLRQRHTVETRHGPITFVSTDARAL